MTVHKSGSKGEIKAKMREIQQNRRPENAFFCLRKSLTKIMETNSCQNNPGPKFYSSSSSKEQQRPFWQKKLSKLCGTKRFLIFTQIILYNEHKWELHKTSIIHRRRPQIFDNIYISSSQARTSCPHKKILGLRRGMEKIYIKTNVKNTQHYQPIMINNLEDDFYLLVAQFTTGERETNRLLQPGSRTCSLTISRPSNCA